MITPRSFVFSRQSHFSSSPTHTTNPYNTKTATRKHAQGSPNAAHAYSPPRTNKYHQGGHLESQQYDNDKVTEPAKGVSPQPAIMAAGTVARPPTPSSAVQIPVKPKQDTAHKQQIPRHHYDTVSRRNSSSSRKTYDARSPDSLPPSVAKLLAATSIPSPGRRGSLRQKQRPNGRMTVDSIVPRSQVSEKELSEELRDDMSGSFRYLSRSPMDVLLSPPDEIDEDTASLSSDYGFASTIPTRVASLESVPSLEGSLGTSGLPSVDSPLTPRGRKYRPPRRSLEPVSSPPGEAPADPLSIKAIDELNFQAFIPSPVVKKTEAPTSPFKSAFKSNLTASLRALRSAARSISTFTASSIPPDDFLTRSILTMDPRIPFTDERMPPALGEEPNEAMRRYLNPTNGAYSESRTAPPVRSYTASIQMQTYKVQRSKSAPPAPSSPSVAQPSKESNAWVFPPGPRQREMRENSDFIRIAVMEHLMRKRGKLDDQREGHARWLLPPRRPTPQPYEIGADGVPMRWVSVSQDTN